MSAVNPTDLRTRLAAVQTFPQLVAFLRDDMGWPIEKADFEDLTFDYEPEELGIDPKNAAKIKRPGGIKRLRPLVANQPWGVFFVQFEKGRLPVVALRRILSSVAIKARPSAGAAHRPAWNPDDLLFVSSYGEGEDRQISFAHFSAAKEEEDLPTLKVLGWDNLDTPLHLDAVARALGQNLSWPADDGDRDGWREQWRAAFTLRHREVITTSKELSLRLAQLARAIRDRINTALAIESERGPLKQLMKAFQTALVHDLDADGFADMYAQTIAYGLLSARIADPHGKTADDFAAHMRTNPFLRELMETFLKVGGRRGKAGGPGIDFDELGVSEVVELLDDPNTHMEAVVRDFGDRNPQEDPVIHFYEGFAKEYDPVDKVRRGEFYTPRPVVSYIVRSVDELLRTEFGLTDGLADTTTWGEMAERHKDLKIPEGVSPSQDFVQILDPATGTGTFLVEVINLIHKTLVAKWKAQGHGEKTIGALWNEYVPKHLLTRLHAYELKMAPYAIAHLKVGLTLYETGYRFGSEERARVYLTNALAPAGTKQLVLDFLPALAHEVQAVNEVKRRQRFTVVIGNPPYSGISSNMAPWIDGLLKGTMPDGASTASYYHVNGQALGERKLWLQDDYVKFIRWSQHCLTSTGVGIHSYISNHGYLDNPTFRGMRWSLMDAFDEIRVLDLHGNLKKKEIPPGGRKDVNIFDIQQGVGIGLFVRRPAHRAGIDGVTVHHADLWGDRDVKLRWLMARSGADTDWHDIQATEPFFLFEPFDQSEAGDYNDWPAINEIMPVNVTGIVTARDGFVIDIDRKSLTKRMDTYLDRSLSDTQVRELLGLKENYAWRVKNSREQLRKAVGKTSLNAFVEPILYRPFDSRLIFWHPSVVWRPRTEAMPHMLAGENVALTVCRQCIGEWRHVLASKLITDDSMVSNRTRERGYVCPLYLYPGVGKSDESLFHAWPEGNGVRRPNLDPGFVETIAQATRLTFVSDGRGDLKKKVGPEDVLAYIYAVLHSPEYRRRFEPMLKLDFPRVPPPGAVESFAALAQLGHDLLALHLLESPRLAKPITEFVGGRNPEVEKISWSRNAVWVDKAQTTGFIRVRESVWNFHIGGYQVCEKWLKDRKGRTLSKDDIAHYQKIVVAISETIRLMREIDEVIEQHGGWPGAFQTGESKAAPGKVIPFRPRTVKPKPEERFVTCVPLVPLKVAAGAFGEGQAAFEGDEVEWVEVEVEGGRRLRSGMFVAQVVGKSMEPEIPDGAYCLFRAPVEGSRQGKTVLVELRDAVDPETEDSYTVKRYESEKSETDGAWRHTRITLRPANPAFQPIELEAGAEERLRVVAELVEVLQPPAEAMPAAGGGEGANEHEVPIQAAESSRPAPRGRRCAGKVEEDSTLPLFSEAEEPAEPRKISDVEPSEAMCSIRDLFESSEAREGLDRESAIRAVARALGFARTGKDVRDAIDTWLTAAARRGIVETHAGRLYLVARSIGDYERNLLKNQFLASLGGYAWTDRDEAIRAFARWMGYARTGSSIDETARSLINGLLREGRLESARGQLRRAH